MNPFADTTEQSADGPPKNGAWTKRRIMTIGLTTAALAAMGGVAIAAGEPEATPSATANADGSDTLTAADEKVHAPRGPVHGEFVFADAEGAYVTRVVQTGTIESVDTASLTVTSVDGFTRSYARTAETEVAGGRWAMSRDAGGNTTATKEAPDLTTGQQVHVLGTLDGDEATAQRIMPRPADGERMRGRPGPGGMLDKRAESFGGDAKAGKQRRGHPGHMFGGHGAPGGVPGERFQFRGPGAELAPEDPNSPAPAAPPAPEPATRSRAG